MLLALFVLMLAGPVIREHTSWSNPEILEIVFGSSFMLFVASLAHNMRAFWHGLVLGIIALVSAVLAVASGLKIFHHLMLASTMLFCLLAVRYSAREVFLAGAINLNKIVGSICIYLLLVITWAVFYEFLELLNPGSFVGITSDPDGSRFDEFVYFSMVTITTLGYGDISPDTLVAGFWAGMEALVGVFYIAILVASLVGDFMSRNSAAYSEKDE